MSCQYLIKWKFQCFCQKTTYTPTNIEFDSFKKNQPPFSSYKLHTNPKSQTTTSLSNGGHHILLSHPPLPLHNHRSNSPLRRLRLRLHLHPRPLLLQIHPPQPNRQCVFIRPLIFQKIPLILAKVSPASQKVPPVTVVVDGPRRPSTGGLPAVSGTEY